MSNAPPFGFPETNQARNWRPGCIVMGLGGGCLIVVLACAGLFAAIVFGVSAAVKSSEPYTQSLAHAQQSEALQKAIGQPIEASFFVQGDIQMNNDDGTANLNYTISGPEGSATVRVVAEKKDGQWQYQLMNATTDADSIDLLE